MVSLGGHLRYFFLGITLGPRRSAVCVNRALEALLLTYLPLSLISSNEES